MIVLDASVLIAHFDAHDVHHPSANALLASAAGEQLAASPITLGEVLVGPVRAGRADHASAVLAQLGVATVGLGQDAPLQLAVLRAQTGLKLPDCCVLLAAGSTNAASLATFDDRLASAARYRGIAVRDH